VFTSILTVLDFIFETIFTLHDKQIAYFGKLLWPKLSKRVTEECLKSAIPDDITQLASYQAMVTYTNNFERKLVERGMNESMFNLKYERLYLRR
jgi:hypothetical protein